MQGCDLLKTPERRAANCCALRTGVQKMVHAVSWLSAMQQQWLLDATATGVWPEDRGRRDLVAARVTLVAARGQAGTPT